MCLYFTSLSDYDDAIEEGARDRARERIRGKKRNTAKCKAQVKFSNTFMKIAHINSNFVSFFEEKVTQEQGEINYNSSCLGA